MATPFAFAPEGQRSPLGLRHGEVILISLFLKQLGPHFRAIIIIMNVLKFLTKIHIIPEVPKNTRDFRGLSTLSFHLFIVLMIGTQPANRTATTIDAPIGTTTVGIDGLFTLAQQGTDNLVEGLLGARQLFAHDL